MENAVKSPRYDKHERVDFTADSLIGVAIIPGAIILQWVFYTLLVAARATLCVAGLETVIIPTSSVFWRLENC
ncbi:hypothetical protein J6590_000148 [Homalodisca vitripennis]|nr:hypothetical protein J6590_000148 [Homalodisca vitripennis]